MIDQPLQAVQMTGLPAAISHAIMGAMTTSMLHWVALFVLLPGISPAADATSQPASELLEYRTSDGDGKLLGTARVELIRTQGRVSLSEKRHTIARGRDELYRVTFDSATLRPISWYRRSSDGKLPVETALELQANQIAFETRRPDAELARTTVPEPAGPYVVEPLIKFYLAAAIARGERSGLFRAVVANEQLTDAVELRFTDLGIETITVGAGSFACHRIKVEPTSALYAAVMPAGEMYFGSGPGHPFVLGTGKAHRLAGTSRTELVSYRAR